MSPTLEDFQLPLRVYNEALRHCVFKRRRQFPFLPEELALSASRWDCHPFRLDGTKGAFSKGFVLWDVQMGVWAERKKKAFAEGWGMKRARKIHF